MRVGKLESTPTAAIGCSSTARKITCDTKKKTELRRKWNILGRITQLARRSKESKVKCNEENRYRKKHGVLYKAKPNDGAP
jgi:hypothetical protein